MYFKKQLMHLAGCKNMFNCGKEKNCFIFYLLNWCLLTIIVLLFFFRFHYRNAITRVVQQEIFHLKNNYYVNLKMLFQMKQKFLASR